MNDERRNADGRFEHEVASVFADMAPTRAPDHLLGSVLFNASRRRKHPRWLALIKEPPMRISHSIVVGSPSARVAAVMVATLLITLMIAGAGIAGSRLLAAGPIVVDPDGGGDFSTISAAVEAAVDGDTILVRPGIYEESVAIDKDIELSGDTDDPSTVVLLIPADGPRVVTGHPERGDSRYAIALADSDAVVGNLSIQRPEGLGVHVGIAVDGGSPTLHDITAVVDGFLGFPFVVLRQSGAALRDSESNGVVEVWEGGSSLFERNRLVGDPEQGLLSHAGIQVDDFAGADIRVVGNTLNHVWLVGSSALIEGNELFRALSEFGPELVPNSHSSDTCALYMVESQTTLRGNDIHDNGSGVCTVGGAAVIEGNRMHDNLIGLDVHERAIVDAAANTIIRNAIGVRVDADSTVSIDSGTMCENENDFEIREGGEVTNDSTAACEPMS